MVDFLKLAKTLIKLPEENGVSKEVIQKKLEEETNAVYLATGKRLRFEDLLMTAPPYFRYNKLHTVRQ